MAFKTTVWETIEAARDGDAAAKNALAERYRPPLISFLERKGCGEDTEDLAQDVLLRLFAHDMLDRVAPGQGRFRSYVLAVTRNVMSEHRRKAGALKRGGEHRRVALPDDLAVDDDDPEFEACWFRDLLQRALDQLKIEDRRRFDVLRLRVLDELPYPEIAAQTGQPVAHVRVDLHRARRRLVKLIKQDIDQTSASPDDAQEELERFLGTLDLG